MAEAFGIDAVADTRRKMPLDRDVKRGERLRRHEQGLCRNEIVALAVHQEDRRAGADFPHGCFRRRFIGGQYEHSRITDDRRRGGRAAKPDMQRHHRPLAEADKREPLRRQRMTRQLRVKKRIQHGCRLIDALPALVGVAEGEREPLASDRRLRAGLRRMRRDESGLRQDRLPLPPECDQVVASSIRTRKYFLSQS